MEDFKCVCVFDLKNKEEEKRRAEPTGNQMSQSRNRKANIAFKASNHEAFNA